jgi:hypothetical protein
MIDIKNILVKISIDGIEHFHYTSSNLIEMRFGPRNNFYRLEDEYYENPESCFNNSIWYFGCSYVFGYDLPNEQSAPKQLEKITGTKVANLGLCGTGPMVVERNLKNLLEHFIPKAVIIAWPPLHRWTNFEKNEAYNFSPWMYLDIKNKKKYAEFNNKSGVSKEKYKKLYDEYVNICFKSNDLLIKNIEIIKNTRTLLKEKNIPLIEQVYVKESSDIKYELLFNNVKFIEWVDKSLRPKDLENSDIDIAYHEHPGPITHLNSAKYIKDRLIKERIL